ncbi:hypothetical protein KKG52_01270 [Patescibacteria group bacterium]|nr:hypothetical protein [Patescibacteria group bacterium]
MRNPEIQSVLSMYYEKKQKPNVFGIKQDDLSEAAVETVVDAYTKATGTPIPNKWIFCSARIQNELGLGQSSGKDSFVLELPTGVGEVVLSASKHEEFLIFNLVTTKQGKPPHLISYLSRIERVFKESVYNGFCELGVVQSLGF